MIIPAIIFDISYNLARQCDTVLDQIIHELILYGSYARGTPRRYSDLNIMLTLNCDPDNLKHYFSKIAHIISKFSLNYNITINVKLITKNQFQEFFKTIPMYKEIAEKSFRYTRFGLNLPNWEDEEYDY